MPALPAVPFLVKILLQMAAPGVASIVNRLFFQGSQQPSNAGLNTACSTIASSWNSVIAPSLRPALSLIGVTAEDLTSSSGANGVWVGSHPGSAGGGTGAAPQAAFIIKNTVPDRYRGGHSRIYLPGVGTGAETLEDANTWNSTLAATLVTNWNTFLANIVTAMSSAGAGSGSMAVPHYYKGTGRTWTHKGTAPHDYWTSSAIPVSAPVPVDLYTTVGYNPTLGTQRRRTHQSV
jgi:hypothetical protein